MDIVFDTVGGETLRRSWSTLKPRGRIVTIAAGEEAASEERVKQAFLLVEANGKQLAAIAELLESGKIRTVLDTVIPLSQAPEAFAGTVRRQGRGKVAGDHGGRRVGRSGMTPCASVRFCTAQVPDNGY